MHSVSPLSLPLAAKTWTWKGFPISYETVGETGPAVVFVHGFGACWGHWRKNLAVLGKSYRCYALDLIGFGGSAKPTPGIEIDYTFSTWGQQVADFCQQVVGGSAFLVGNSIGAVVVMQTAIDYPDLVLGVAALNCSLRLLHERKRGFWQGLGASMLQSLLSFKPIGHFFFQQIAKPEVVRKLLLQAYGNQEAVTEELVEMIMKPTTDPGAADVFLAFTRYAQGPLPEDLLSVLPCSAILLWGSDDPWEPIELGRELALFPAVTQFIPLEGVGHCPQDEAPEIVNPILLDWLKSANA